MVDVLNSIRNGKAYILWGVVIVGWVCTGLRTEAARAAVDLQDEMVRNQVMSLDPKIYGVRDGGYVVAGQITIESSDPNRPAVIDCNAAGRAFHVRAGASLTLKNVVIRNGRADKGGAIFCDGGTLILQGCYFVGNRAARAGAGIEGMVGGGSLLIYRGGKAEITDCVFAGSRSDYWGGAVYSVAAETVTIRRSTFLGCSSVMGGAIAAYGGTEIAMDRCSFSGNQAHRYGGTVYLASVKESTISNSTFIENSAASGAGLYCRGQDDLVEAPSISVINCTFTSNMARDTGGAVYNEGAKLKVLNSILWGNTAENRAHAIAQFGGTLELSYSNIEMANEGIVSLIPFTDKGGLIQKDPGFIAARTAILGAGSSCIDKGFRFPEHEDLLEGRIFDGNRDGVAEVDIGAHEYTDGTGSNAAVPFVVFPQVIQLTAKDQAAEPHGSCQAE